MEEFSGANFDDIISFSGTWQVHATHQRAMLSLIRSANLTLSADKFQFAAAELDYFGHHIGLGRVGLQPRMKKVEALLAYPVPVNREQLQSFLGLAGYYRKFVPNYAQISAVLSDLLSRTP